MSVCKIYLFQARINIIKPLRGFNFGGDVFAKKNYLASTKSIICQIIIRFINNKEDVRLL